MSDKVCTAFGDLDDLLRELDAPEHPVPDWLACLKHGDIAGLNTEELRAIAAERDERGAAWTVYALIDGLILRHRHDPATTAVLLALRDEHLPALRRCPGVDRP